LKATNSVIAIGKCLVGWTPFLKRGSAGFRWCGRSGAQAWWEAPCADRI